MSTKNITFDTDSGVAYHVHLVINSGADFKANFNVNNVSNAPFDFTGWTGTSSMAKSVSIGSSSYPVATFNVGFTSASSGKFNLSLGSSITRGLTEGRYVYDILVSSGSTVYRIVNGNILVIPGISSAP